jgi:hypothetical protein
MLKVVKEKAEFDKQPIGARLKLLGDMIDTENSAEAAKAKYN